MSPQKLPMLLSASALSAALMFSSAQASMPTTFFKSGFYAGSMAGYSRMNSKVESSVKQPRPAPLDTYINSGRGKASHSSAVFDLLVGGRYLNKNGFMPGFELALSVSPGQKAKTSFDYRPFHPMWAPDHTPLKVSLGRRYSVTPSLVLGWVVSERVYLFGKLGLSIANFKMTSDTGTNAQRVIRNKTLTKVGFSPALGAEYAISPRLSAVGLIQYDRYGSMKQTATALVPMPAPYEQNTTTNTFKQTSVYSGKVGLIYKF